MIRPKLETERTGDGSFSGQVVAFKPLAIAQRQTAQSASASTLTFTWEILEQQLADLAVTAKQQALVGTLVSATRKQALFKSPEMVLREVLCIASVLMDETFHPELGSDSEEGEMT